jgi:hypothetical protein
MVEVKMINMRERWTRYSKSFIRDSDRKEEKIIKDIPVMFGIDGSIVCLPHRKEPNNVSIVGKKGTGKSLMLHRICEEIFWLWNENVCIMNDIQEECSAWNYEQENENWIAQLECIKEEPLPLPIIYLYPHTDDLNLNYVMMKKKVNFIQITVPFSEVINNSDIYLKLGKTARYIRKLKPFLLQCEIPQDVYDFIEDRFSFGAAKMMKDKILAGFDEVFREGILNITDREFPSELAYGKIMGNPFLVLMKLGIIPCFETNNLSTKRYMPEVFAYHLNSIFQSKFHRGLLAGETVYIFFDELTHICSDSPSEQNSAWISLCKIAARGRRLKIGLVYATQNYSKVPRKIKLNTDYVFAFQHSNEEEVKKIKNDFDLRKTDWKEIMKLQDFEVIGITNEHFVCYKKGKKWTEEGPIKGRIIPPQSNHLKPS